MGARQVAVVDPGPNDAEHIRALLLAMDSATTVRILLTHGHGDHAGGAARLAELSGGVFMAPVGFASPEGFQDRIQPLREGDRVPTDQGNLEVLEIPGHTRDHLAFHWVQTRTIFVGDLLLGRGSTTWIGEYLGCVADYLESLDRVEALAPAVLYPSHGPPITSPAATLERFRRHRLERLEEVRDARRDDPEADAAQLARMVYGAEIPRALQQAAEGSVRAALYHLDGEARSR